MEERGRCGAADRWSYGPGTANKSRHVRSPKATAVVDLAELSGLRTRNGSTIVLLTLPLLNPTLQMDNLKDASPSLVGKIRPMGYCPREFTV